MVNGASSADFYIDAVTNNSFEMKYVEDTLQSVLYNSYGFLDNAQKHSIGLSRSNFLVSDLIGGREGPRILKLQVPRDLIDPSSREEYRKYKFYRQMLTISNIAANQDIFARMPIVFIDGKMTTRYTIKAFFDKSFLYFKDTPELRSHKEITVFFVPNDGMSSGYVHKKSYNSQINKLPAQMFSGVGKWESSLSSIVSNDELIGSSLNLVRSDGDNIEIEFNDNAQLIVDKTGTARLTILKSRYMHTLSEVIYTKYAGNNDDGTFKYSPKPFVITDDDGDAFKMPIPVENIIVLKRETAKSGDYILDNSITVSRIYPNIYIINDENAKVYSSYRVIYFYHPMDGKYYYTNYMENYHKLAIDYFNRYYGMNKIEDIVNFISLGSVNFDSEEEYEKWLPIVNYSPRNFDYSESDILKFWNPSSNEVPVIYPFDYKIDKMCEAIRNDPWVLHNYVKDQSHCTYGYELNLNEIRDILPSRRRNGSGQDARFLEHRKPLSEPCYLFKLNIGSKINFELTFFIDGLYVQPEYVFEEFFTKYIYLPCKLIDTSSMIDIEVNNSYVYEREVTLTNDTIKKIILNIPGGSNIHPIKRNIHVRDESGYTLLGNEVREKLTFSDSEGKVSYSIDDHAYAPIEDGFSVSLTDKGIEDSKGESITYTIIVDKSNTICDYTSDEDPVLVTMMPRVFFDDQERVRIFVNGKLMDTSAIMILYYDSEHSVLLLKTPLQFGDKVNVLLSPNFYRRVFTMPVIPEDGLINLAYELNKPINVTYYDFYLNGRKLSSENIVQLSPCIIQIHNVNSRRNLIIFEKDRDPTEYFGDKTNYKSDYNSLMTFEDEVLATSGKWVDIIRYGMQYSFKETLKKIIWDKVGKEYPGLFTQLSDKEPDILRGMISDETADMIIYIFKTMYGLCHINPDELLIDGRHVEDHYRSAQYWLRADSSAADGEMNVFSINPDVCASTGVIVQPVSGDKLYTQYKIDYEEKE